MSAMIQLVCTHCQHRFEMEKQEGALCPSCGWSSSVVSAAQLEREKKSSPKTIAKSNSWIMGFLIFALKFLLFAVLFIGIIWGAIHFFKSRPFKSSKIKKESTQSFSLPSQSVKSVKPTALSTEEEAALYSKLNVPAEIQLSDQEQGLLQKSIDLTAGDVEKLPSGSWAFDDYKKFIEIQEKKFRMPLARSYKKSLEDLFQKTYATAYDLFLAGKIQSARDAYLASLAFPVYGNDIRKHRAVILTMLRDFVNDTIAKIGALNFTLARQNTNGMQTQISTAYAEVQQYIRASQWKEGLAAIQRLKALIPDTAAASVLPAPPYGPEFGKIDGDIQPVLLNLMRVPAWSFDLNVLKSDLEVKRSLLNQLTDFERKASIDSYNAAMEKIQFKAWPEAITLLNAVKSPQELKQDADQKIGLIAKLTGTGANL